MVPRLTRRGFLAAAGLAATAGCLGGAGPTAGGDATASADASTTTDRDDHRYGGHVGASHRGRRAPPARAGGRAPR
ncbi:MAG: twin-arginine translocation signal domain-containing protein [Halobacteriales archaeon]|nr:twin-arginine translocation signal domain-containing protein [Halobacteriales archaeon]